MSNDIVIVNKTRYRYDDARRLGLLTSGEVVTAKSVERTRTTDAPDGLLTTGQGDKSTSDAEPVDNSTTGTEQGDKSTKPALNASTADWTAYALANGKTEDDLNGLKRDDIAALFADQ